MDKEADDEDWEEDDRVGKGEEEERDEKKNWGKGGKNLNSLVLLVLVNIW